MKGVDALQEWTRCRSGRAAGVAPGPLAPGPLTSLGNFITSGPVIGEVKGGLGRFREVKRG